MLTKNNIKHLRSLELKKNRDRHKEYIVEGEKIIKELIRLKYPLVKQIFATEQWFKDNYKEDIHHREAVCSVSDYELSKISSLKTPGKVIAVLRMPGHNINKDDIISSLSLVLDTVQDPGNLGNIIRIADWFGIRNIFCSSECADCYNPKVVQATMGSIIRVNIYYVDLKDLLEEYSSIAEFTVYGTFLQGEPVYNKNLEEKAFIVLGNESKGISERYLPYIKSRLFIPKYNRDSIGVESLNVAAAAAVICSEFRRR
jgi:TrmH family RNA methyltransferase